MKKNEQSGSYVKIYQQKVKQIGQNSFHVDIKTPKKGFRSQSLHYTDPKSNQKTSTNYASPPQELKQKRKCDYYSDQKSSVPLHPNMTYYNLKFDSSIDKAKNKNYDGSMNFFYKQPSYDHIKSGIQVSHNVNKTSSEEMDFITCRPVKIEENEGNAPQINNNSGKKIYDYLYNKNTTLEQLLQKTPLEENFKSGKKMDFPIKQHNEHTSERIMHSKELHQQVVEHEKKQEKFKKDRKIQKQISYRQKYEQLKKAENYITGENYKQSKVEGINSLNGRRSQSPGMSLCLNHSFQYNSFRDEQQSQKKLFKHSPIKRPIDPRGVDNSNSVQDLLEGNIYAGGQLNFQQMTERCGQEKSDLNQQIKVEKQQQKCLTERNQKHNTYSISPQKQEQFGGINFKNLMEGRVNKNQLQKIEGFYTPNIKKVDHQRNTSQEIKKLMFDGEHQAYESNRINSQRFYILSQDNPQNSSRHRQRNELSQEMRDVLSYK